MKPYPAETAFVLYDVDKKAIVERLKAIIDIKEKGDISIVPAYPPKGKFIIYCVQTHIAAKSNLGFFDRLSHFLWEWLVL